MNQDKTRLCLVLIDIQNTFCNPGFELFVGGQSGMGAVEDSTRLCEFIYRNLGVLTDITVTLDTHTAMQIFHSNFWINDAGDNPEPLTMITLDDVQQGRWKVNLAIAHHLTPPNLSSTNDSGNRHNNIALHQPPALQSFALHYVKQLSEKGKYPLTIWPYHSMLGGIGHALVSSVEEACFFHNLTRHSQTHFEIKGSNPLTENYSVLCPEVTEGPNGHPVAQKNTRLIQKLLSFDGVIIAGQAKSHCVAWTIDDLLSEIQAQDPTLAQKVYLLEDCTSPVVVPGVVDFTDQANTAFQQFAKAGIHLVRSDEAIAQ